MADLEQPPADVLSQETPPPDLIAAPAAETPPADLVQPANEAPPTDLVDPSKAAPAATDNTSDYLPIAPSKAFLDRYNGGREWGKLLSRIGEGVVTGWGSEPLGFSQESLKKLQDAGLFANPETGGVGYLWPIELGAKILEPGVEAFGRAISAGMGGIGFGVAEMQRQGLSIPGMGTPEQAERDIPEFGNIAALLLGSEAMIRKPTIGADGRATVQEVGGLPRPVDFQDTARAFSPDGPPMVNDKLVRLYQEKGLHPAEVFADARRDVTIAQDMLATDSELPRAYVTAYHGSPHTFEQFDISKVGTGEGAQSFGHGLYFAEKEGVAESYMAGGRTITGVPEGKFYVESYGGGYVLKNSDGVFDTDHVFKTQAEAEKAAGADLFQPSGNLYRVELTAPDDSYLLWDKPLSEQPAKVQQAINSLGLTDIVKDYRLGSQIYRRIAPFDEDASAALSKAGIAGVKYLDQQSRAAGEGTYNYVVFDPKDVRITHRNGEALTAKEETAARDQMADDLANAPEGAPSTAAEPPAGEGTPPGGGQPPRGPEPPEGPPPLSGGTPEETVLSKISVGKQRKPGTWWQRLKDAWDRFYANAFDDLNPIEVSVRRGGVSPTTAEDPYRLARLTRGAPAKADMMLNRGTFDWNTLETNGPGLKQIVEPVKDDLDGLRAYIASKRAVELADRGIEPGIDLEAARRVIAAGETKFGTIQQQIVDFQDKLLQYLRDSGVISQESYDAMKAVNRDYVPYFRIMDEEHVGGSGLKGAVRNPVKAIKGSERAIVDPLESIIKNTYLFTNLAERNAVGRAFIKMADDSGNPGAFYEKVPPAIRPTTVTAEEMQKFLADHGMPNAPEDLLTVFRAHTMPLAKDEIAVFENGKRSVYRVDPEIAAAFNQLDRSTADFLTRLFAGPARLLRAGATVTPEFITRNIVRDFSTAFVTSKGIFSPIDTAKGLVGVIRKDADWEQFIRGGGAHATMVGMDRNYLQQNLRDITGTHGVAQRLWNVVRTPYDALRVASELAENATRLGEFKKVMAQQARAGVTGKAAAQEAAFAAREVTLDFARMGAKMRAYNMITAFANAQLQGVDRIVRAFKDAPFKTTLKVGAGITLPSVLLWFANRDDPRYQEVPNWQKDLFWIIITDNWERAANEREVMETAPGMRRVRNGVTEINRGHIYRVPKPFEIGVAFGSGVERALDAYFADRPEARKDFADSMISALTPSFVPTAGVPILEQFANRSSFTGRNLIPAQAERLLPEYQYTPYTTELAKSLAAHIGAFPGIREARTSQDLSFGAFTARALTTPVFMENYVRSWTGGLGKYLLDLTDLALRKAGQIPDPPTPAKKLEDIPVVRAFMIRYPSASTQSIQDFYDIYNANRMYWQSWLAKAQDGDVEAMTRIRMLGGDKIFNNMDVYRKLLSEQSQLIRNIWKLPQLTPEQKRQQIDTAYWTMTMIGKVAKAEAEAVNQKLGARPK